MELAALHTEMCERSDVTALRLCGTCVSLGYCDVVRTAVSAPTRTPKTSSSSSHHHGVFTRTAEHAHGRRKVSVYTPVLRVETDFGQSDFGHPYPTDFGQTDSGQTLAKVKVLVVCKDFGFWELIVWVFRN